MIFFILFLVVAIGYHMNNDEPMTPTLICMIPTTVISLLMGSPFIGVLIGSVMLFALVYGYFTLLGQFSGGTYFVVMIVGLIFMAALPFLV